MCKSILIIFASLLFSLSSVAEVATDISTPEQSMLAASTEAAPEMTLAVESLSNTFVELGQSCCKICRKGKACGDTCISRNKTCHVGLGCACNGYMSSPAL